MQDLTLDAAAVALRPRLVALAYRMLGSMTDAEDVVQESLLKARRASPEDLESPEAFLMAVTSRTAIDQLRSARVKRTAYVGPWLPEPVLSGDAPDPGDRAVTLESISMAFLVLLEALSPHERAVLLLHDVFGYSHAEVGVLLDRSDGSCRQLLRRARAALASGRRRFDVDIAEQERLVQRFRDACERGAVVDFVAILTEDATFVSDGGAEVKAARHPIRGADRIARFLAKVLPREGATPAHRIVSANGGPALAILHGGRLSSLVFVEPAGDDRAARVWMVRNPAKLAAIRAGVEQEVVVRERGGRDRPQPHHALPGRVSAVAGTARSLEPWPPT